MSRRNTAAWSTIQGNSALATAERWYLIVSDKRIYIERSMLFSLALKELKVEVAVVGSKQRFVLCQEVINSGA